jgi:hydroxylamine reductase (hybrid-cluster protein)
VASGIFTVVNPALPVEGGPYVRELLTKTFEKHFGATWAFEEDPVKAARLMIDLGTTAFDHGRARAFLREQGVRP